MGTPSLGYTPEFKEGTIGFWPLVNSPNDVTGNGYHLLEVGPPTYQRTPDGGPSNFNAGEFLPATYFNTPAALKSAIDDTGKLTWEFYIYFRTLSNSPVCFVSNNGGNNSFGWGLQAVSNGSPGMVVQGTRYDNAGILSVGKWFHIAFTYDGDEANMYASPADAISSTPVITRSSLGHTYNNVTNMNIGRYFLGAGLHLAGHLKNLRIMTTCETSFPVQDPRPFINKGL